MADTKSVAGFSYGEDSLSYDGKSVSGTSSRSHARRARHMLKLKNRLENTPTRKLLFRPRQYDWWKEGDLEDEIAERQRLLADIAAKEARLLARRKEKGDEDDYRSDSDEENETIKALDRLKSRKEREEGYKQKLEEEQARREQEAALELEEKLLSELQNPSVYGWFYTDGYYDNHPYFGVREDLVPKLAEEQEQWREKWSKKYPETFTEKFKRYFWPPKLCCRASTFRTRGSYMDFPEVISDWPKLLADVNFEREPREYISNRHELFGPDSGEAKDDDEEYARLLAEQEEAAKAEEEEEEKKRSTAALVLGKMGKPLPDLDLDGSKEVDASNFYYDDDTGEFYRKKIGFDIEYFYDGICWRHKKKRGKYKSENQQAPYDYYFDDVTRDFKPREEYRALDEIVYDHKTGAFRIHVISKPDYFPRKLEKKTKSGRTLIDLPEFKDLETTDDEGGEAAERKRHKPTSYYFDEELGKWILRAELPEGVSSTDISWEENGKRYTRKFEGPWRGLTGLSPDDYYFDDRTGKFNPKPARQADQFKYYSGDGVWRKADDARAKAMEYNSRSDDVAKYYFDEFEGQFKKKDFADNARYIQGRFTKIWRKIPKPKSGLYPQDYYWDTHKKRWLPRAIRYEMLKNAEVERARKLMAGTQAGPYWDIKKSDKDVTKDDYYFDYEEGIYLKKNDKEEYVYEETDQCYRLASMKDKPKSTRFHHEYFYDAKDKTFILKGSDNYEYDQKFHVWKKPGEDLSETNVKDWCYDMVQEVWTQNPVEAPVFDPNLCINVRPHSDSNFRTPCDWFFNIELGKFVLKDIESSKAGNYVYDPADGSYKLKNAKGPSPNNLTPRSFFWDDQTRSFKLKISGRDKDYFYDGRNKLFRHILASGRTKSGFRPKDFVWNSEFKQYIPLSILKKQKGEKVDQLPKWDPLRGYDKPWVTAAPLRNPDTTKKDERTSVQSQATDGGWFGAGGKTNKVAPAPQNNAAKK